MVFTFWQPTYSIHQSAFLRNLANTNKVKLILERDHSYRQKQGWNLPNLGNVQVYVAPSNKEMIKLLCISDAIHCFSGINTYKMHYWAFRYAVKKRLKIGVMLEPFDHFGLKGKCRFLKYLGLRMMYNKYISFMLTTGDIGRWCYERTGFSKNIIFDWGYFTESDPVHFDENGIESGTGGLPNLIYIGELNQNKGIIPLINVAIKNIDCFSQFYIIGDGDKCNDVKNQINHTKKIKYLGRIPNEKVHSYLRLCDICILPTIGKEGWGAVVNEALIQGTPVIASNHCGASVLLDGKDRGEIFSVKKNDLEEILKKWLKKGKVTVVERKNIADWAKKSISGNVAANYYLDVMNYVFQDHMGVNRPIAPWVKIND